MKVIVSISKNFKREVKPLLKRYPSLSEDLKKLEEELYLNPRKGTALGFGAYKIRLKIKSKGKGKSGGARVISLVESAIIGHISVNEEVVEIVLLSIYDRADADNDSDAELKEIIKKFMHE